MKNYNTEDGKFQVVCEKNEYCEVKVSNKQPLCNTEIAIVKLSPFFCYAASFTSIPSDADFDSSEI